MLRTAWQLVKVWRLHCGNSRTIVIPCHWWVFELFFLFCSISFRLWVTLTCSFLQSLMKTKRRTKHYHQALQLCGSPPQIREVQEDQSHTATRRFHQLCQVHGWQITCHLWRKNRKGFPHFQVKAMSMLPRWFWLCKHKIANQEKWKSFQKRFAKMQRRE